MGNLLLFLVIFFLPGICILWLIYDGRTISLDLGTQGALWLAIPTSFTLSIGLISFLGWLGYFLKWRFTTVRLIFFVIFGLLILASTIRMLYKKWRCIPRFDYSLLTKSRFFKSPEFIISVFILAIIISTIYGGTWFSHTADSINHIAAVRSIIKFDNPLTMQIYWSDAVEGMDPTFGTWHLALAIWASIFGMDLTTMWLLATILLAPLIILTFILLAVELTQNKFVAFFSGLFFVFVHINGDFRISAHSNRMGQIFLWLSIIYFLLAIKTYHEEKYRSRIIYTILAAFLGWAGVAIHIQYGPALLGILIPTLIIILFINIFSPKNKKILDNNSERPKLYGLPILGLAVAVCTPIVLGFFIRSVYTISNKYPLIQESSQIIMTLDIIELIKHDFNTWFTGWDSYITIASIISILVIFFLLQGKLGAIVIIVSNLILPSFIIITNLFVGRGGLILSTFGRLKLLMPPFLLIGWSWVLFEMMRRLLKSKNYPQYQKLAENLLTIMAVIISLYSIFLRITDPSGGIVSIYSPNSDYKTRISVNRESNLLLTRTDAIQAIRSIPDGSRILADIGVSYEMAGLTGKLFILFPSQHTPLQEKELFTSLADGIDDFLTGMLNKSQMVEVLIRHKVDYVYVDRERYNGDYLWNNLPSLPILDQVSEGDSWRIYRVNPENAEKFMIWDEQARNTDNFFEKVALYKELENIFQSHDRYYNVLKGNLLIDYSVVLDFVKDGQYYARTLEHGVVFDFLQNLDEATILPKYDDHIERTSYVINFEPRGVISQKPSSQLIYNVDIPNSSQLNFSVALDPTVWEAWGEDGVEFLITIEHEESLTNIFKEYIDPKNVETDRKWLDFSLDLSAFGGENVNIIFETQPGYYNNYQDDLAGWGEPRIQNKILVDIIEEWDNIILESDQPDYIKKSILEIAGEKREYIYMHPSSKATARVAVPVDAELRFGLGIDQRVWSNKESDGMEFKIYIHDVSSDTKQYLIFDHYLHPVESNDDAVWQDYAVDLSMYGGHTVEIIFETLPGNNDAYDWGGWSSPYIIEKNSK